MGSVISHENLASNKLKKGQITSDYEANLSTAAAPKLKKKTKKKN